MIQQSGVDDFKERIVEPLTFDFKSRFEKKPEVQPKKKYNYLTRVGQIYRLYLKMLLGRQIDSQEYEIIKGGISHNSEKQLSENPDKVDYPFTDGNQWDYINEIDYHMGDIVIAFPNPDHPETKMEPLTALQAIEYIKESFSQQNTSDEQKFDNQMTLKAIEQVYYLLDNRLSYFEKRKRHKEKRVRQSIDSEREDREYEELLAATAVQMLQESPQQSLFIENANQNLTSQKSKSGQQELIKSPRNKYILEGHQTSTDPIQDIIDDYYEKVSWSLKLDLKMRQQSVKEYFQIDFAQLRDEQPKIMQRGFYLLKQIKGKQRYFSDDHEEERAKQWTRSDYDTSDFLTLVRNAVLLQLTKLGYVTRQFISQDGKKIFCVVYSAEKSLWSAAVRYALPKKLNFAFTDLFSLEPVDHNLRPIRLNTRLWRNDSLEDEVISPLFKYLKPIIKKLIKEINFKLIAKEMNISQLNQKLFQYGMFDQLNDEVGPTDDEWQAYYEYLIFVKEAVNKARKNFHQDNDQALLINGQLEVNDLILKRLKKTLTEMDDSNEDFTDREDFIQKAKEFDNALLRQLAQIDVLRTLFQPQRVKVFGSKHTKLIRRELLAQEYVSIFMEGIKIVNMKRNILKTIWDFMEIQKVDIYAGFSDTSKDLNFSTKQKLLQIWQKYSVTENKRISIFSYLERIKLTDLSIQERLNTRYLLLTGSMTNYFCLNSNYELHGSSHKPYFIHLLNTKISINQLYQQNSYLFLYYLLKSQLNPLSIYKIRNVKQMIKTQPSTQDDYQVLPGYYLEAENQFYEPLLINLEYLWKFRIGEPWYVPSAQIKQYYGERVSLYFHFLGYTAKMLVTIGIFGFTVNILQVYVWDQTSESYTYITMIYGFIQEYWVISYFINWCQEEYLFTVQHGIIKHEQEEQQINNNTKIIGIYKRSIQNDQLNTLTYPKFEIYLKQAQTVLIQIFLILIYFGLSLGLFGLSEFLGKYIQVQKSSTDIQSILLLQVTIPAFINVLLINFSEDINDIISFRLTQFEGHESILSFDSNYVFKRFFLVFMMTCGPISEILFIFPLMKMKCVAGDCNWHCKYYFATILLFQWGFDIFKEIKKIIMGKIQIQLTRGSEIKINPKYEDPDCHSSMKTVSKDFEDPFQFINYEIESQAERQTFGNVEINGTIHGYLRVVILYSMLALFGQSFPSSFILAFFWILAIIQDDKNMLLHRFQRPLPQSENTIGIWKDIIRFISHFSILQNSALITYQIMDLQNDLQTIVVFLFILFFNIVVQIVQENVRQEQPYYYQELLRRQKYIINSTFNKFKGISDKTGSKSDEVYKDLLRLPIYKIWGTVHEEDNIANFVEEDYKTDSSMSDLEDRIFQINSERKEVVWFKQSAGHRRLIFNQQELRQFQEKRISNWAFQCRFYSYNKDEEQKLKQEKFLNKIANFLRCTNLLSDYKMLWTDQRLSTRSICMPRRQAIFKNLDYRRFLVLFDKHKRVHVKFQQKMQDKYYNQLMANLEDMSQLQNQIEFQEIVEKIQKYVQKHSYINTRKIVTIKLFAVVFHQFRKQSMRKKSKHMLEQFLREQRREQKNQMKRLYRTKPLSPFQLLQDFVQSRSYTEKIEFNFKDFLQNLNTIIPPEKKAFNYTYSNRQPNEVELIIDDNKPLSFRRQHRFLQELVFGVRAEHEEQGQLLYLAEQYGITIEEQMRKQYKLKLLYCLDSSKHQANIKGYGCYAIQNTSRWLVLTNRFKDSTTRRIRRPKLEEVYLQFFTTITLSEVLYPELLSNITQFYKKLEATPARDIKGFQIAQIQHLEIIQADPLDKIDNIFCKGYISRIYRLKRGYFSFGQTLRDVIQNRSKEDFEFIDANILLFLNSTAQTLQYLQSTYNLHHGGICPTAFYQVSHYLPNNEDTSTYALVDIGFNYWWDGDRQNLEFVKMFCESQEEGLFASPEVKHNFQFPDEQKAFDRYKSDVYSLGLVCLEMMSLGQLSAWLINRESEAKSSDLTKVTQNIQTWLQQNREKLQLRFPQSYPLVSQMAETQQENRPSIQSLSYKYDLYTDSQVNLYQLPLHMNRERLDNLFYTYKFTLLSSTNEQNHAQNQIQNQIELNEFLEMSTARLRVLTKLKLVETAKKMFQKLESLVIRSFFEKFQLVETPSYFRALESFGIIYFSDLVNNQYLFDFMQSNLQISWIKLQMMAFESQLSVAGHFSDQFLNLNSKLISILQDALGQRTSDDNLANSHPDPLFNQFQQNQVTSIKKQLRKGVSIVENNCRYMLKILHELNSKIGSLISNILYITKSPGFVQYVDKIQSIYAFSLHIEQKNFIWNEIVPSDDKKPEKPPIAQIIGKTNIKVSNTVAQISQEFLYRLCLFLDLKLLKLKYFYDSREQQEFFYNAEEIQINIRILRKRLKNLRIRSIDPNDTSTNILAHSDFSMIPLRLSREILEFSKILIANSKKMQAKQHLSQFQLSLIPIQKFKRRQPRCILFKILNMPIRRILLDVYLQKNEEKEFKKYLTHIYKNIIECLDAYENSGVFKNTFVMLAMSQMFLIQSYLRYLPARKIRKLTDFFQLIIENEEYHLSGLFQIGRFIILGLKLEAQLYSPVVSWLESSDENFVRIKRLEGITTTIDLLKNMSRQLSILHREDDIGWINSDCCNWLRNNLIYDIQYYYTTIHAENQELTIDEKIFLQKLDEQQLQLRSYLSQEHKNQFFDIYLEIQTYWSLTWQGRVTYDQLKRITTMSEQSIINYIKEFNDDQNLKIYMRFFQSQLMLMALMTFYLRLDRWVDFLKSDIFQYISTLPHTSPDNMIFALMNFLEKVQQIEMGLYVTNLLDQMQNSDLVTNHCLNLSEAREIFVAIYSMQPNQFKENQDSMSIAQKYVQKIEQAKKTSILGVVKDQINQDGGEANVKPKGKTNNRLESSQSRLDTQHSKFDD